MSNPYIMRKGVSVLNDLFDGAVVGSPPGAGQAYYAIQTTEAFYEQFLRLYQMQYMDGTFKVHTTIQAAIDATLANRGDIVYVIGEWAITTPILLNKWGTTLSGATVWDNQTGGGNSNITSTEEGTTGSTGAVINVTKAKTCIQNLVLYFNGIGDTYGIIYSSSAPSQSVVRNVCIVKNGGTTSDKGIGIHFHTVPTRSLFENIKITGAANATNTMAYGIQGGSYSSVFRDIVVSNATVGINLDTYGDLFQRIIVAKTCATGMDIYGAAADQSMMVDCRNMGNSKGTMTNMIFSGSYSTGLTELTA